MYFNNYELILNNHSKVEEGSLNISKAIKDEALILLQL